MFPETGSRITVVKGKGSVQVLSWGGAPFGVERTKRGSAFIPSGFKVRCKSDSQYWVGETLVNDDLQPQYQFSLEGDVNCRSGWFPTSTAAYNEANKLARNDKFNKGSNGRLIIGVTYPVLQEMICRMNNLPFNFKESGGSPSPRNDSSGSSRERSYSQSVEEQKEPDSPKRSRHSDHDEMETEEDNLTHHHHRAFFVCDEQPRQHTMSTTTTITQQQCKPDPQTYAVYQGYVPHFTASSSSSLPPSATATAGGNSSSNACHHSYHQQQQQQQQTRLVPLHPMFAFDDDTLFLLENLTSDDIFEGFDISLNGSTDAHLV